MAPGITWAPIWSLICRQPIPCGAPAAAASTMETCLQGEREHRAAELALGFDSRGSAAPFAPCPALTQLQLCHGTAVKRCSSTLQHQQQGQVLQVTPRFMVTSEIPPKKLSRKGKHHRCRSPQAPCPGELCQQLSPGVLTPLNTLGGFLLLQIPRARDPEASSGARGRTGHQCSRLTCPEGSALRPLCGSQCYSPAWPGCPSSSSAAPACRSFAAAPLGTPARPSLQGHKEQGDTVTAGRCRRAPSRAMRQRDPPAMLRPPSCPPCCSCAPQVGSVGLGPSQCPAHPLPGFAAPYPSSCPRCGARSNPCLCPNLSGLLQIPLTSPSPVLTCLSGHKLPAHPPDPACPKCLQKPNFILEH